ERSCHRSGASGGSTRLRAPSTAPGSMEEKSWSDHTLGLGDDSDMATTLSYAPLAERYCRQYPACERVALLCSRSPGGESKPDPTFCTFLRWALAWVSYFLLLSEHSHTPTFSRDECTRAVVGVLLWRCQLSRCFPGRVGRAHA